jgi:hypothetical protein
MIQRHHERQTQLPGQLIVKLIVGQNLTKTFMKTRFLTKTLIAVAVAVAAMAAVGPVQAQPMPPPTDGALPANIVPGSPLAEVVKMVQAGVDIGTIQSYIANSPSPFNLDADKIITLKDLGVPNELVNAMMERDKILYASTVAPPPVPAPVATDTAPPPAEVTVNYFYDNLTPYGSWLQIDGFGRCWRPTVAIYDPGWRPYCDRGHWLYTDYDWYWDSNYSWGMTFHYGRWFHHARWGWLWYPDTVWAPSWVTWRSGGDYCGWAPLPPFAVFTPGIGFFYRGVSVGLNFDFGLGAECFMFCAPEHFCDRQPRSFCLEQTRVKQIFYQTTVINNFNVHGTTFVNHGIPLDHITSATHHAIEAVHVSSLPNAGRQGWRGEGYQHSFQHSSTGGNGGGNFSSGNNQFGQPAGMHNNLNNTASAGHNENLGQVSQGSRQGGNQVESLHTTSQPNLTGQGNNNNQTAYQLQHHNEPLVTGNSHSQQSQQPSTTATATVTDHRLTQNNWRSGGGENGQSQIISHGQTSFQSQQTQVRGSDSPALSGAQQHGASQLEQHQFTVPSQPRVEQHVEPVTHNNNPPPPAPAPSQGQSHNSNSGSNNGNNNGSNNGSGNGKQNH